MPLRGAFITLDGPEGSGKSTQARRLVAGLRAAGYRVTFLRDPGSTPLGRSLRRLLLHTSEPLAPLTEALLFIGGRVRLVEDRILPALRQGKVVICDRFHDSTIVYQGYGGGVPVERLDRIGRQAVGGVMPSLTLLLHVDARRGFSRLRRAKDRMERKQGGFHQRVERGYMSWAKRQRGRIVVVDAGRPAEAVQQHVRRVVRRRLGLRIRAPIEMPRGRAGPSSETRKARGAWRTSPRRYASDEQRRGPTLIGPAHRMRKVAAAGPVAVVAPPRRSAATTPSSSRLGHGARARATRLARHFDGSSS